MENDRHGASFGRVTTAVAWLARMVAIHAPADGPSENRSSLGFPPYTVIF